MLRSLSCASSLLPASRYLRMASLPSSAALCAGSAAAAVSTAAPIAAAAAAAAASGGAGAAGAAAAAAAPAGGAGGGVKLWGGRFTGKTDPLMEAFNNSLSFDKRMWRADLDGSIAYAKALSRCGILTADEATSIVAGLHRVRALHRDESAMTTASAGPPLLSLRHVTTPCVLTLTHPLPFIS